MLTRIHAPAVCRADDESVPDSCEIPDGSPDWSIHGLWPNYKNGSYPQFCDGVPKKFDGKLIEPIERRLSKAWPNLYPTKSARSLWKHEWEKHGTCSQNLRNLSSELLYFNVDKALGIDQSLSGVPSVILGGLEAWFFNLKVRIALNHEFKIGNMRSIIAKKYGYGNVFELQM
ncbi:unnamed protein product [Angiostrongylus costaricensis]|uniref:Ribonuclease T(2) n=1 Tax=Angiostrongylus costaricensis TaxID=334426 RepID=A0A158PH10_ANGCS|nr:unnamed protein product [Angiostrongylus costaricensis]